MRLRKPCIHDRYDAHQFGPWAYEQDCPGGEFLPGTTELAERLKAVFHRLSITRDHDLLASAVLAALDVE